MPPTIVSSLDADTPVARMNMLRAVLALAVGGFAIGTGEFAIMGLLPDVAGDIGVSIPEAGHVISAYALGVVLGAPLVAVLSAGWGRRRLLMALMAFFALGNFASAMAPDYLSLSLLRFASGLPHGTYFGVAALVAATLASPGKRGRAVGLVMLGLTVATLVGVPIAAWVGQALGWRAAYVGVGLNALLGVLMVRLWVPEMPAMPGASPLRELSALARKQVWLTLGIAAIGFGGMFSVYSYITPTLIEVSGLSPGQVPPVLALFGLGMVVGNLVGARLADRALMPTIGATQLYTVLVLAAFSLAVPHAWAAVVGVFLIGTTVAIGSALQIRLMDVAGEAQTLAAALHHSAFNIANGLGAWLGGAAIAAGWGWTSTGWVGALLGVAGLGIFGVSVALERQQRRTLQARSA